MTARGTIAQHSGGFSPSQRVLPVEQAMATTDTDILPYYYYYTDFTIH